MLKGFLGAAIEAEIRYTGRSDLSLIYCEKDALISALFTANTVKAAPILDAINILKTKKTTRAILINSGNANACTGEEGLNNIQILREDLARLLKIDREDILFSSTGVIGVQLPVEKIRAKLEALIHKLSPEGLMEVPRAILTTDTCEKVSKKSLEIGGKAVNLLGFCKGAGMIAPNLEPHATMLAFILTDVNISHDVLSKMLSKACEETFNRITVDGDMSTNDTVIILANGLAGNPPIINENEGEGFYDALKELMHELAVMIVRDGEGATKLIKVQVSGLKTQDDAKKVSKAIAESLLFKTAIYGEDPNWGRIMAAAGKCGVNFKPNKVTILFNDIPIYNEGVIYEENETKLKGELSKKDIIVSVKFSEGDASYHYYTCDLTHEYVNINAKYRT